MHKRELKHFQHEGSQTQDQSLLWSFKELSKDPNTGYMSCNKNLDFNIKNSGKTFPHTIFSDMMHVIK